MMRWSDVIGLGTIVETVEDNEVVETISYREVFANKLSVRSKEFYEARTIDLKPELMFEVRSSEYNGEEMLKFDSIEYSIIRTYDIGEITELICSSIH